MSRLRSFLTIFPMLLLISGCERGREGDHLDLGMTPGTICVPRGADEAKTFGAMDVHNVSEQPVRLTRVDLADARGLEVVGARLVTATNQSQLVADGWPPQGVEDEFSRTMPMSGRVLAPGELFSLWTGVLAPEGRGIASAIRVHYAVGDSEFYQDGVDALRIIRAPSC